MLDCRFDLTDPMFGRRQHQLGHIPGAVYMDLEQDLSGPTGDTGGRHPLPAPVKFIETLRTAGVTAEKPVVCYDDSRFAYAARAWWLLRAYGHPDVRVLDGGYRAWQQGGYTIETEAPYVQPGTFVAELHTERVAQYGEVLDMVMSRSAYLVDCRERSRYLGEQEPIDPVAGHIPGAMNYPWQETTDEQGYALSVMRQAERWERLPKDQEVVFYCGSGVTACVNLLSMALAGRDNARLYAGSWSDWCAHLPPARRA